jgi:hypothetical protein
MQRNQLNSMMKWLNASQRKPLIIRGARYATDRRGFYFVPG